MYKVRAPKVLISWSVVRVVKSLVGDPQRVLKEHKSRELVTRKKPHQCIILQPHFKIA